VFKLACRETFRETKEVSVNLGQYISDLIRIANEAQKVSASTNDPQKIYHLALEAKETAGFIQAWASREMAGREQQ
jgi:hypothetical protein